MAQWLVFLLWLLKFSTWKTFFVHIFTKLGWGSTSTPSLLDGNTIFELEGIDQVLPINLEKACLEEISVDSKMPQEVPILEDFQFKVSDESTRVEIRDNRIDYTACRSHETIEETSEILDHDTTLHSCKIWKALANSTAIKTLDITIEKSDFHKIGSTILEGVFETLASHQSVDKLKVFDNQVDSKLGTMKHMSRVLHDNKRLVEVTFKSLQFCKQDAMAIGNALRHNRTLNKFSGHYFRCGKNANPMEYEEALKLLLEPLMGGNKSNNTLEEFDFGGDGTIVSCFKHMATIIQGNTSFKSLRIWLPEGGFQSSSANWGCIGDALGFNTRLIHIEIHFGILGSSTREMDILCRLCAPLVPNAHGQQANTTLTSMRLSFSILSTQVTLGFLTDMLQSNTSLIEFGIHIQSSKGQPNEFVKLFESLKNNTCLQKLNFRGCNGVRGDKVLGTIMDLLLENHHIKEIDLTHTDFDEDESNKIIQAVLEKKAKDQLWEVVQGMATTPATSGRVFLCGHAYAGKSFVIL